MTTPAARRLPRRPAVDPQAEAHPGAPRPAAYQTAVAFGWLAELIAFRTVSAHPAGRAELRRCATWLADLLPTLGCGAAEPEVAVWPGRVAPVVTARWPGPPGAPKVMVYGHYDVQPAEPLGEWTTPPFTATRRGSYLHGRGATDDKGQLVTHLAAIDAWLATDGRPPVDLRLVLDGEEEIGSPTLVALARRGHPFLTAPDVLVVSDTRMLSPTRPQLVTGLRGSVTATLTVTGAPTDLHAGAFGGAVPDPAAILAQLIASLHTPAGRTALATGLRARPLAGESVARRPAVVVTDLVASAGGRTVVSAWARARLNLRLAAGQRPGTVVRALRRHLAGRVPPGVRVRLAVGAACPPYRQPEGDPGGVVGAARRACLVGFGVEPVMLPSGGSIPFVNVVADLTGMPVLLLGFGLPGDRAHAPNERFHLPSLERGTATCAELYGQLGRAPVPLRSCR